MSSMLNGTRLTASLNNITFLKPRVGLLQAHHFNINGVFRLDFPDNPPTPFNYCQSWYYTKFNLVDPDERNTVGVPIDGETSIRFREDGPGIWFVHCHLVLPTGWGLKQHLSSRKDKAQINLSSLHLKTFLPASFQNQPVQFGMFENDG
uniref:Plastocyanin-like domain-containing protein n=1 Tax=Salix viminalis TaxID=40686 RepID=A0A6N2LEN1_SALVM